MKLYLKLAAAVLFVGLAVWLIRSDPSGSPAVAASIPAPPAGDPAWRLDALWDDGRSEVCAYRVRWPRNGQQLAGRALLTLVKEPWAPDLEVKADRPRPDGFDVLKLNHVRDVPSGLSIDHQMASVFFRRDDGSLRKLAAASAEAFGITTARMVGGRLALASYADGRGDRELPWPAAAIPEDGLPAALRDYVLGPVPATLEIFPTVMTARPEVKPYAVDVERRDAGEIRTPEGALGAVELRLTSGRGERSYVFEAAAPHRLIRFEDGTDGRGALYELAKCERLPDWRMQAPAGRAWLPPDLR